VSLITSNGAIDWSNIAEKLNDAILDYIQNSQTAKAEKDKLTFTARNGK